MGCAMPEYKFYAIKRDGHVKVPPAIRDCPNDGEALKEARPLVKGHDIEVGKAAGSSPTSRPTIN